MCELIKDFDIEAVTTSKHMGIKIILTGAKSNQIKYINTNMNYERNELKQLIWKESEYDNFMQKSQDSSSIKINIGIEHLHIR